MKRLLFILGCICTFVGISAAPLVYKGSTPASGSEISSWDFELDFDMTDAIAEANVTNPGHEFGIGYRAISPNYAYLYKGDSDSGVLLGESMSTGVNGKHVDFKEGNSKVKFSFSKDIPIENGQQYTVVIKNAFYLYWTGTASGVTKSRTDFSTNPIILTFTGADMSNQQIFVESSSLNADAKLQSLKEISYYLSAPFDIVSGAEAIIYDNGVKIASTNNLSQSASDPKQLIVLFDNDVPLYREHKYSVVLPTGTVTLAGTPNAKSLEYLIPVEGLAIKETITVAGVSPDGAEKVRPEDVIIYYNIPEGYTLTMPEHPSKAPNVTAYLYENEIRDDNAREIKGYVTTDGKGIRWYFGNYLFKPATKYFLKKEANSLVLFDMEGTYCPEYSNDEAIVSWTTPSRAEAGYAEMEFKLPELGKTAYGDIATTYREGMSRSYLSSFSIELKDKYYFDGDKKCEIHYPQNQSDCKLEIYEILPSGDKLLKSVRLAIKVKEDPRSYWNSMRADIIQVPFYEGKQYRLVIPEGAISVLGVNDGGIAEDPYLQGYIYNQRMEFVINGQMPAKYVLKSCNVENNSKHYAINNVLWILDGTYRAKDPDLNATEKRVITKGYFSGQTQLRILPVIVTNSQLGTSLFIDLVDPSIGEPDWAIQFDGYSEFIIPAGALVNVYNEDIVNDEIKVRVYGVSKEEEANAQLVDVEVTLKDDSGAVSHSTLTKSTKGSSAVVTLAPDANWQVTTLTHNGNVVNAVNGVYTSEPLTANAKIAASLKFKHDVTIADFTTGVGEVIADGSAISIGKDGDSVVVKGLKGGEHISVYSLNGMMVKDTIVGVNMDSARISLPADSVLIILVESADESQAFKVKL